MPYNYYAVARGRTPGIYDNWGECKRVTEGYSGPLFRGFNTRKDAEEFLRSNSSGAGGTQRQPTAGTSSNAGTSNASVPLSQSQTGSIPGSQTDGTSTAGSSNHRVVRCKCPGKPPLAVATSHTAANPNRAFYSCSRCNFFTWADTPEWAKPKRQRSCTLSLQLGHRKVRDRVALAFFFDGGIQELGVAFLDSLDPQKQKTAAELDANLVVHVEVRYHAKALEIIKMISPKHRSWSPDHRQWVLRLASLPELLDYFAQYVLSGEELSGAMQELWRVGSAAEYRYRTVPHCEDREHSVREDIRLTEVLEWMFVIQRESFLKMELQLKLEDAATDTDDVDLAARRRRLELLVNAASNWSPGPTVDTTSNSTDVASSTRTGTGSFQALLKHQEEHRAKHHTRREAERKCGGCGLWLNSSDRATHVCRFFGSFRCNHCDRIWKSAYVWRQDDGVFLGQQCGECSKETSPYETRKLEPGLGRGDRGHHRADLCRRCQQLGHPCNDAYQ